MGPNWKYLHKLSHLYVKTELILAFVENLFIFYAKECKNAAQRNYWMSEKNFSWQLQCYNFCTCKVSWDFLHNFNLSGDLRVRKFRISQLSFKTYLLIILKLNCFVIFCFVLTYGFRSSPMIKAVYIEYTVHTTLYNTAQNSMRKAEALWQSFENIVQKLEHFRCFILKNFYNGQFSISIQFKFCLQSKNILETFALGKKIE